MSTAEAQTTNPAGGEVPIPEDLTITVTMRRPFLPGTRTVVEFIPETSRRAIFEEYREIALGISAEEEEADEDDFDEDDFDGE